MLLMVDDAMVLFAEAVVTVFNVPPRIAPPVTVKLLAVPALVPPPVVIVLVNPNTTPYVEVYVPPAVAEVVIWWASPPMIVDNEAVEPITFPCEPAANEAEPPLRIELNEPVEEMRLDTPQPMKLYAPPVILFPSVLVEEPPPTIAQ